MSSAQKKYKTKDNFIRRRIAENDVLIPVGAGVASFNGFIELNPSAALIWDTLKNTASQNDLVLKLTDVFGISYETAEADVSEFLSLLTEHSMIEEV